MTRARVIGITGGIASGKSTVTGVWKSLGAVVLDADEISRHALDKGSSCYDATVAEFGAAILNEDGSVNRPALSGLVFQDPQKLEKLNSIIHPYVYKRMEEESMNIPLVVWDVPLLIESGMARAVDCLVLISCGTETRVKRIMERDGASREQALSRISAQLDDEHKRPYAHYVLENNGSRAELIHNAAGLWRRLEKEGLDKDGALV